MLNALLGFAVVVVIASAGMCAFTFLYTATTKWTEARIRALPKQVKATRWIGLGVIGASTLAVLWMIGWGIAGGMR